MGHSNIRAKVRRRKVAALAAYSRQHSVKNTKKNISPVVEHERKIVYNNPIVNPLTGNKFDQVNPHPIPGKFGISITGYDWVEPEGLLWEHKRYKQPKRLIKYKKSKKREKRNDFERFFRKYPYTIAHSAGPAYYEKLVAHKLEKWDKKNPKPNQDLFDKVEDWEQKRFIAEQRFRDFVVSIYDKLPLIGRFKMNSEGSAEYQEEKIAEIKDINGEGHKVNEMTEHSPLLKKAKEVTNKVKAKRQNLVVTNLKDHKRQKGRMILPQAA